MNNAKDEPLDSQEPEEEKSFFKIIVHSFFIIPFLIAVFGVLLFAGVNLLTREKRSAYDYLEDVKIGGLTKRWQGAFELSKILANPELLPEEGRFLNELINAFEHAKHDDNRVRQYLALAMGRTENSKFLEPLIEGLLEEKEENIPSLIYALGMLRDKRAVSNLYPYLDHQNARIRSITAVALGNIGDSASGGYLRKGLNDSEANVQWGVALSLAKLGDDAGKNVILKLLDREYLGHFPEVDANEQNHLLLSAIEAASLFKDKDFKNQIEWIAKNDGNMKIRAAAMKELNNE